MSFSHPVILLLLILTPVFFYLLFIRKKQAPTMNYGDPALILAVKDRMSIILNYSCNLLLIAAWIALVVALAGPRSGKQYEKRLSEGVDLVVALDVSGSMRAVDNDAARNAVRDNYYYDSDNSLTNRLTYAKLFTARFIKKRNNDRIGLVVFAGYSYTKCPLTFDHAILIRLLEQVDFDSVNQQTTAIGLAIANSISRLTKSKSKSKVIILITDGMNTSGAIDPLTAAEAAKTMGIRIHTIGFGSRYPLMPARKKGYFIPSQTYIDESTLKTIATNTGGKYFRATGGGKLNDIYEQIDRMEKTVIERRVFVEYSYHFQLILKTALLMILSALFIRFAVLRVFP